MQKTRLILPVFLLFTFFMTCLPKEGNSQFVTIARKIKSMKSNGQDVATVIMDAGAARVYQAVIDTLNSQHTATISKKDKVQKKVEFTSNGNTITLQVDSIQPKLSQITVLAVQDGSASKKATDVAVNVILSVCHKLGLQCSLKQ